MNNKLLVCPREVSDHKGLIVTLQEIGSTTQICDQLVTCSNSYQLYIIVFGNKYIKWTKK